MMTKVGKVLNEECASFTWYSGGSDFKTVVSLMPFMANFRTAFLLASMNRRL